MISEERLSEIKRLWQNASPGPWVAMVRDAGSGTGPIEMHPKDRFLQCDIIGLAEPDGRGRFFGHDAVAIAAARQDIPELLAEIDRLRAEGRT